MAIPALDEATTIRQVIAAIPKRIPGVSVIEVAVIDDGSRDGTGAIAREEGARVVRHPVPAGVGAAFHSILELALSRGVDYLVTLDGDGQFDPRHIPSLLAPVLAGEADFATASRFKDPTLVPDMPAAKRLGNRLMSRLVSRLAGQPFHDVSCGMRCYSRRAALNLHVIGRFTYTQEVFLSLAFKKLAILEVPLPVEGRRAHGESRVARRLAPYAWRSAKIILRAYRDYHPLQFFGALALAAGAPAAGLAGFLLWHFVHSGTLSPHKWAGAASGLLFALAVLCAHLGVVGDMLTRHRVYLEEILVSSRSRFGRGDEVLLEGRPPGVPDDLPLPGPSAPGGPSLGTERERR